MSAISAVNPSPAINTRSVREPCQKPNQVMYDSTAGPSRYNRFASIPAGTTINMIPGGAVWEFNRIASTHGINTAL